MPIPGETFVLRLREPRPTLVDMNVLDLSWLGAGDPIAMVSWGLGPRASVDFAAFSLISLDPLGNVNWQLSRSLCAFSGVDCAKLQIEQAEIARTSNGVIVAGTAVNLNDGKPHMFAMRVTNKGAIMWARRYGPGVTTMFPGRITAIAPMETPDHFLIAAASDADTWLFEIDGNGLPVSASKLESTHIRRMRLLPTQGICAVGELLAGNLHGHVEGFVLSLDPVTGARRWSRTYTYGLEGPEFGLRWFDIAEGSKSLLVVGNHMSWTIEMETLMAFLELDPSALGDVRRAMQPGTKTDPVRLRSVAAFTEDLVPLGPIERKSRYAVSGESKQKPFEFLIGEDFTIQWQKIVRTPDKTESKLSSVVWPTFDDILLSGHVKTLASGVTRGFITSSPVTIGRGTPTCSEETNVAFPDHILVSSRVTTPFLPFSINALDCFHEQAPDLIVTRECLDAQG
ncbi:MAG TPA: hypothetical protein VF787_22195 [Thermoanaerobaculia bacterium]